MSELGNVTKRELKLVSEWLTRNNLTVNRQKPNYIVFKYFRRQVNNGLFLKLAGKLIERRTETKILGLFTDEKFSRVSRIIQGSKKLARILPLVCTCRNCLPLKILKPI